MASKNTKNQSNLQNLEKKLNCISNRKIYIDYAEITGKSAKNCKTIFKLGKKLLKFEIFHQKVFPKNNRHND
mgnify:CR=1 FL=1